MEEADSQPSVDKSTNAPVTMAERMAKLKGLRQKMVRDEPMKYSNQVLS
jgi:hypothetical protein